MFSTGKVVDLQAASLAASHEISKYDKVLGLRIGIQRAVDIANKLPLKSSIDYDDDNNDDVDIDELYNEINRKTQSLLNDFISILDKTNKKRKKEIAWDDVIAPQQRLQPEWERVVNKFHSRLHFGSEQKKSNMKIFNETIWDQISVLMNDDNKVIEKSTMPYNDSNRIDKLEITNIDDSNENSYDAEVYDDRPFYSTLLKTFITSNASDSKGMSEEDLADIRRYKKKKNNVDRKASKGRKLRYNVHTKLQNFMFPIPYAHNNDVDADRVMQSLFQ